MLSLVYSAYFFKTRHCFNYLQRYKGLKNLISDGLQGQTVSQADGGCRGGTGSPAGASICLKVGFKRKNLPQNSLWENVLHNKIKRHKDPFFARTPYVLYFLQYLNSFTILLSNFFTSKNLSM
jgi:hypothetical protein